MKEKFEPVPVYVCITSPTRPGPWHAWWRAASHLENDLDLNYFERMEAAKSCIHASQAMLGKLIPPQRAVHPFGWGNFPHLNIDNRRKP